MRTETVDRPHRSQGSDDVAHLISRKDIELLTEPREGPCVSLSLPTQGGVTGTEQDRIRLKNLLEQADARLVRGGLREPEARTLLAPAADLLHDPLFWEHRSKGLALFLAPGWWRTYRLPLVLPERAVVSSRFHVSPLLPLLAGDGHFYVLALSQNDIRLLAGTRHELHPVELEDVPRRLSEALRYDDPQKERNFHAVGRQGVATAISHGHGIGGEVDKERISRYLRLVDSGLADVLRDQRAPLVLAGTDYERAIYRAITAYPMVIEEGISGNPDHLRADELHERAWHLVEPVFRRAQQEAEARYRELVGTGRTTSDLADGVAAAGQGRVEVLFVRMNEQRWGTFDPATGRIATNEEPRPGDEDLLDLAAVRTLLAGGTVYAVPSDAVPGGTSLAAILRF